MTDDQPPAVCWKVALWPPLDQRLWEEGCAPHDPFDDYRYGSDLSAESLEKAAKGYGRFLCFLASRGWFDPAAHPLERVSRSRLRAYFHELQAFYNADATVIGRFDELWRTLKIMCPGKDVSWIRKPTGITIYALLRKQKRVLMVPDSGVLFAWGIEMMDGAMWAPESRITLAAFRDGLMIAMFAARARRLRAMASIRVGFELKFQDGRYRIELPKELVKTKKRDHFSLPTELTTYVHHYLKIVRPALLKGGSSPAVWISVWGTALSRRSISNQNLERSRERFGTGFGTHRYRHAAATSCTLQDPGHPGLAAEMLGISKGVVEESYDRANQVLAANRFAKLMDEWSDK